MSVLGELSRLMEEYTDAYAAACDEEAEKENAYLRRFSTALLDSEAPATVRAKTAECQAVEERCAWNDAVAARKRTHAKVEEVRNRLMAAMSHQRFVREATGG